MKRLLPARLLAALRPDTATRVELPGDMLRESRHRILVAAALGAAAYAVFLGFELTGLASETAPEHSIDLTHDLAALALCTFLLIVTLIPPISDRTTLAVALAVEFVLSSMISVAIPWAAFIRTGHVQSLTWVVPIIILFPLLVPAPPRTTLIVSMLCALTMPAGLVVLAARGVIRIQPADVLAAGVTGAVAVGIATIASRTLYHARRQVAAVRAVGSYELLERLGQGGMGEVWKARHSFLARPAAVKLILPEKLQGPREQRDSVVKRFTREAQVTASLHSPHTVQLYDFGVSADGTFYYAMELLEGMTVEHFVYRFGPVEPQRAVHWLRQACHSLGEAHAHNLIHRDIKPGNLYLCRYGRDVDFVKVLDFGLTKVVADADSGIDTASALATTSDALPGVSSLTDPGRRMGTPGYMAPEQVFGLPSDPRTDVYALGCVGYWLLAGVKPFEAESAAELLQHHAQTAPPPLASRGAHRVPERLEALILSCLSKDPAERPDIDHLSAALEESVATGPWTEGEAHDWWEKNLKPS